MAERSVSHDTFAIERTYDAPPARVFRAFADREAKDLWFAGPPDWETVDRAFDFRVGGREVSRGRSPNGQTFSFDCVYQDIVPDERIVYTYDMHMDDRRISVSLATIELEPVGAGTRLIVTEQGVFLDGLDRVEERERGTQGLLDALGASLQQEPARA